MKKGEVLNVLGSFAILQTEHLNKESKVNLSDKVFYALSRSIRLGKEVKEEVKDLYADFMNQYKLSIDFNEENQDEKYIKEVNEGYTTFLTAESIVEELAKLTEAESNISFFKIDDVDLIDQCVLVEGDRQFLEKYLLNNK